MSSLSTSKYLHYIGLMSKQERQHDDDIQSNVLPEREVRFGSLYVMSLTTLNTEVRGPSHFDQGLDPMVHEKPPAVMQCPPRFDNPPARSLF